MVKKEMMHSPKCIGTKMLVLGVLIVLNAMYDWFSWPVFIGGLIALKGLAMIIIPKCACK